MSSIVIACFVSQIFTIMSYRLENEGRADLQEGLDVEGCGCSVAEVFVPRPGNVV